LIASQDRELKERSEELLRAQAALYKEKHKSQYLDMEWETEKEKTSKTPMES